MNNNKRKTPIDTSFCGLIHAVNEFDVGLNSHKAIIKNAISVELEKLYHLFQELKEEPELIKKVEFEQDDELIEIGKDIISEFKESFNIVEVRNYHYQVGIPDIIGPSIIYKIFIEDKYNQFDDFLLKNLNNYRRGTKFQYHVHMSKKYPIEEGKGFHKSIQRIQEYLFPEVEIERKLLNRSNWKVIGLVIEKMMD